MATFDKHQNFAIGRVLTAPSPAVSGTTLVLQSGEGTRFPDPATYGAYNATVFPTGIMPTPDNAEIVRITARSTDTLTITRATESSTARTIQAGDTIIGSLTAKSLTDIEDILTGTSGWPADIIPDTDDIYDIGSALKQWHDGFFGGDLTANGEKVVKPFVVVGMAEPVDYLCDGTDDDVQIQSAITAVNSAGGGVVFIKEGTYDIGTLISISSNVTLEGEGWTTILKSADDVNIGLIYSYNTTNVHIKNLAVDMNRTNNTTITSKNAIYFTTMTNSKIENIYLHDMKWGSTTSCVGIGVYDSTNIIVKNNYLSYMPDYGIATAGITDCQITDNYIHNATNHGIEVHVGTGSTARSIRNIVSRNIIYYDSATLGKADGIKTSKTDYTDFSNNIIYYHPDAPGATGYRGIHNDADARVADSTADSYYGVGNTYSNNIIYNFYQAIYLKGQRDFSVSKNNIEMVNDYASSLGVYLTYDERNDTSDIFCTDGEVVNNRVIYPDTFTELYSVGIESMGGSNVKIDNNFVKNALLDGISLEVNADPASTPTSMSVCNNTVEGSGRDNIRIYGSYHNISNNISLNASRTTNNAGREIIILGGSYNVVNGNQCYSNGTNKSQYCIREVASSDYNSFVGNIVKGGVTANVVIVGANTEVGHNIGY